MGDVKTLRLTATHLAEAQATFRMMAAVFDEAAEDLSDDYVMSLLNRGDFWVVAAIVNDTVVGGATAHTLPMTRCQGSELFLYDLAVRADHQRRGVGRRLVDHLCREAAAEKISVVFVPADNDDAHALDFYRAIGGTPSPVTFFTFGD